MREPQTIDLEIQSYLHALRCPAIKDQYDPEANRAATEQTSYQGYLHRLLELECNQRASRRKEKYLQESKIPLNKTMDTFDLTRLAQQQKQQIKQLLTGRFLAYHENVMVFGSPGSGKSHLLCGIGQSLIEQGHRVYFSRCNALVQELLQAKASLRLASMIKRLSAYEAIIIDDIGYVSQSREEMEVLFMFIAERYERGSIMLTSNLPFSQWERIFKDPMVAAAAIDRLVHHSVILEMNVASYRMDKAKESQIAKPNGGDY
ncbi:MAG: IS21-like element helper ATPase IstB [Syntrophales bacterium]